MKKYRIKTEIGYLMGFNSKWQCIQSCDEAYILDAKVLTRNSLDKFIAKYTGLGYGFDIEDCIIEEII